MLVCSSPKLIAAYHVLHRLSDPRHPPCALNCFKKIQKSVPDLTPILVIITRYYNFLFPNMSKNFSPYPLKGTKDIDDVYGLEPIFRLDTDTPYV